MKKILNVFMPSIFLIVFGSTTMLVVSSCVKQDDGSFCSICVDSSQCNAGLECHDFPDHTPRCVTKQGDTCPI